MLLFVFAANRGWLGPELRVALGALASVAVFATGLWMRRRFGTTYAALGAVGAGIAGGYATLLASAVLYEQLDGPRGAHGRGCHRSRRSGHCHRSGAAS